MSIFLDRRFPPLDMHAHIAADVADGQLRALEPAFIFAVTRSLEEASAVRGRTDARVIWGCGVHPGLRTALDSFVVTEFLEALNHFYFVGEVGLDRRAGRLDTQESIFLQILSELKEAEVLVSIHSSGCPDRVLDALDAAPPKGAILHWFGGDPKLIDRANRLGAYFSINNAMAADAIAALPPDRILPETDYPSSVRRTMARKPGDISALEESVANALHMSPGEVRRGWYRNLRALAQQAGVLDRLPSELLTLISAA